MNQKMPVAPQQEQKPKTPEGESASHLPRDHRPKQADASAVASKPRHRAESLVEEERHAGISTVLFALTVSFVALFVCALVGVLTVKTVLPSVGGAPKDTSPGDTAGNATPNDPGATLFTPGAVILPSAGAATGEIVGVDSSYAILVDAETGNVLAGKRADERFSPASMTKVMTLLVACENLKTGDLTQDLTNTEEIHNYVRSGKYRGLTVHWSDVGDGADLLEQLYGIGVVSAADCVMMVATYICKQATPAENEAAFVALMNAEVAKMGLQNTHFDNPVGYESENNYSTAADMAAIMMRALQCDQIREILSTSARDFSAFGYNSKGEFNPSYPSHFYSTLFNANGSGRIAAYEKQYGTFRLSGLTLGGGKTGTLGSGSNNVYSLVSFASDSSGKTYIAVTGETTKNYEVMKDAKTIYDTYAK